MPDDYQQGCDETNIGAMNTVPCRCCNPDFVGDAVTIECVTPCPSCTIGVWEYYQDETCEGGTQAMHIGDSCDLEEMLFVRQMPTICVCNT